MSFVKSAFDAICREAKAPEGYFVCLMVAAPFYGGPEEGGWWGDDVECLVYQQFPTLPQAIRASNAIDALAAQLEHDARREHGLQCLREMDWLDERGLDADWLPEVDGPSHYWVTVCRSVPEPARGSRQYS